MPLHKDFFVSDRVHERTVKLPNGEEHPLHFKEVTEVEFRKFLFAEQSDDEDRKAASRAYLISVSLCEADGKPVLTLKQAMSLHPAAAAALSNAVSSVITGVGQKNVLPPGEKNGSGTS